MKDKDKQRIVALQRQLSLARVALEKAVHGDLRRGQAEECLDEMNRIEWASKPNLVQGNDFHGRNFLARR